MTRRTSHLGSGSAFTLFEVVISMLVLSIAILSSMAMLPSGLQAQRLARYQLFAGSTALTLMEEFHSPLISFRGHGTLAPEMGSNLANTDSTPRYAQPPVPGWANRLRDTNLLASPYAFDIERDLSGWVNGIAPLPLDIARRLDSDGDEIQLQLDRGGALYYLDPGYVRGLGASTARDKSQTLDASPEAQRLVFTVAGYAQQNALTSHPVESWPWYELYPFPPAWVALKASGFEIRRGPVSMVHSIDPLTHAEVWSPPIQGENLLGQGTDPHNSNNTGYDTGIFWGDGGPSGWAPVTFPKAPMNMRQLRSSAQNVNPIDPEDAPAGGTVGWYQGRNWRHFAQSYGSETPWAKGWKAFQRLAGFNDDYKDLSWNDYADYTRVPREQHYERAGWLPVMAMLINDDNARYDHFWYDIFADPIHQGKSVYRGETTIGSEDQVGTGVFPPRPGNWAGNWDGAPWRTDQRTLTVSTGAPYSLLMPTYEMRAGYRDKALALWYAVAANVAGFGAAPQPGTPEPVTDTQGDCDQYEYGPAALEAFTASAEPLLDPHALTGAQFPPHPAQVLALSYLAHAAMLVTGWDAPFMAGETRHFLDWDCLVWHYAVNDDQGRPVLDENHQQLHRAKDAKVLAKDANEGATAVTLANDSPDAPIVLYRGDFLCFEQDYRDWVEYTRPRPYYPAVGKGVVKYRVARDVSIGRGASGSVELEPPLAHGYHALIGAKPADASASPPTAAVADHPQQLIRLCNDQDRAFARTVHEMCMRWAACYCSENAYDWGAPRMMNHQTMGDKPLAILDLFEDAAKGPSSSGVAQRTPQHLPTSAAVSPIESFYRWIQPPNPAPRTWFREGTTPANGPVCAISHFGPTRRNQTAWLSLAYNDQLAPPSTPQGSTQWNWTSDAQRYWLNRPFQPFHRGRQLVFWAVDWRSYDDAETAPSAPLDLAKHARQILLKPDGLTVDRFYPMLPPQEGDPQRRSDSQFAGNPENALLWTGSDRRSRYLDTQTDFNRPSFWTYAHESDDIVLGHWGADRNNNRNLDQGPVPRSARLRALTVARFNVYDPVLRLHNSD